jgi:predicted GH43/DUF377 family glycosyl hydrolase
LWHNGDGLLAVPAGGGAGLRRHRHGGIPLITADHHQHLAAVARYDRRYARFTRLPVTPVERPLQARCKHTRPAIRFDHHNLFPKGQPNGCPGVRFNPSIIASGDGYLFVWRHGWAGCNLYACRLDADFRPVGTATRLKLRKSWCKYGREDPRWFRLNGKLHVSYTGVVGNQGPTNVCFARVNEQTLEVEDKWHPRIPGRQAWEKNHAYFDYQGIAHAVYSIHPHRILRVEGSQSMFVAETRGTIRDRWQGGRLCGGASPVLHNGKWWHFFHGSTEWNGRRQYNAGLAVFSAEPPFAIERFTPYPVDVANPFEEHDAGCDVLFPGGAVCLGDEWVIASGAHDRWAELRFYDAAWLESQLENA